MIAIQKIGKSFTGALNYNLKKLYLPDRRFRGELLASNFMSVDARVISKEIAMVRTLRPNLNRYVYHTSLNFPDEDQGKLTNDKLLAIALDYLLAIGFTNNQYLIFRHHDAGHPHLHLLVNRICFDGTVVSDSHNFRRSEKILRELEYHYNLVSVDQSNFVTPERNLGVSNEQNNSGTNYQNNKRTFERPINISKGQNNLRTNYQNNQGAGELSNNSSRRGPTRNEAGMMIRTGKASNKLLLQELILHLIQLQPVSIADFIRHGEKLSINFLFNQASTGRVSGITYFFRDFRAKGQGLGNQFKWAELSRKVPYNADIDNAAIGAANKRTMARFGLLERTEEQQSIKEKGGQDLRPKEIGSNIFERDDQAKNIHTKKDLQTIDSYDQSDTYASNIEIQITNDIDDEAILGRDRRRKGRTNTR
jgi:hypothetical protein